MRIAKSLRMVPFFVSCLLASSVPMAGERVPILGAGPSTAVVNLFFEHFAKTAAGRGYEFQVEQRSIKHAGGIRASDEHLFGRTGRPLNEQEKEQNKADLFLARVPLTFVVGAGAGVERISMEQLEAIYTRKITNWRMLGGANAAIVLAGRESKEAALGVIKEDYPFFQGVVFDEVLKRDHQMVNFIKSYQGRYAIGFGAKSNFEPRYLLAVDGFESGVRLGLVYDLKNEAHPLVKAVREYAQSDQWRQLLRGAGFLPAD